MINSILNNNDCIVKIKSKREYDYMIQNKELQVKGKSKYENYWLLEYLPRNKEFYVIDDSSSSYEDGEPTFSFTIATTYKGMYFEISCWG